MFLISKMDVGQTPPIEYRKAAADEDIVLGEALSLAGGLLTKCAATTAPEYVAVGPQNDNGMTPVVRIHKYMEFETTLQAAGTSLSAGSKVTLHTDGLQVTATTASGVAEITRMAGTAAGSTVYVRF